jgi:hypothetical protein
VRNNYGIGHTAMFVQNDEIGDIVGSTCFGQLFYNVSTSVYSVWIWEYKTHFLWCKQRPWQEKSEKIQTPTRTPHTLANCKSFELGSLDVVITIFGSIIPALEYSLSIWVIGSTKDERIAEQTSLRLKKKRMTNHSGPHQMPIHSQGPSPLSSTLSEEASLSQVPPSPSACAQTFGVLALR